MKVIAKIANAGKTTEMVREAVRFAIKGNSVLILSSEMTAEGISRIVANVSKEEFVPQWRRLPITIVEAQTPMEAKAALFDYANRDIGMVAVDCNFAVSRPEWFNLLQKIENAGAEVVATQQVVRTGGNESQIPLVASKVYNGPKGKPITR